jgi:phenylacetate-CoA ligase
MREYLSKYIGILLWKYGRGSDRFDFFQELRRNQWNSIEKNRLLQRKKLFDLVQFSIENIPYYKNIAREGAITISEKTIFEDIRKFPVLTKEIIRREFDNLCYQKNTEYIRNMTGGTTGQPLVFYQDKHFKDHAASGKMLFFEWAGLRYGELLFQLWGSEKDILESKKGLNDYLIKNLMNIQTLNSFNMSNENMKGYVDKINSEQPRLMLAYTQSAVELARYVIRNNMKIVAPLNVMTSAGTLYDSQRHLIERAFGGKVFNKYGSREASDIACECERQQGIHINILDNFIEVLDDKLENVSREGQTGDIYVTCLNNFTMPFIRYKIGDSATVTEKSCDCGRGFPLLRHIIGRSMDGIRNAHGKFIPAEFFIHFIGVVFNKGYIDRFQVIQDSLSQINIRVTVNNNALFMEFQPEIERNIKKVFETPCTIVWKLEERIEDPPSGKFRYVISNVFQV